MNLHRVIWALFWLCVMFAFAHKVGLAVLFGLGWLVLWVGRRWLAGRR
jgi:hypothetical protein